MPGLQPVEGNAVNLCALIRSDKLQRVGSLWDCLLIHMQRHSPHLSRRLNGARSLLGRPPCAFVHSLRLQRTLSLKKHRHGALVIRLQ